MGQVRYNIGASLSDAWSKVLELTNNENVPNPGKNTSRLINKPINAIYVYQTDGIFQNQEEVDAFYEMYYYTANGGVKPNNILPAPGETGLNRLRPGARKLVDLNGDGAITTEEPCLCRRCSSRFCIQHKGSLGMERHRFLRFAQGIGKQNFLRTGSTICTICDKLYSMQNSCVYG